MNLGTGIEDQPPAYLAIVEEDTAYFLYYLDEHADAITDTWHETIEDAFAQAEFEFAGTNVTWIEVKPNDTK